MPTLGGSITFQDPNRGSKVADVAVIVALYPLVMLGSR